MDRQALNEIYYPLELKQAALVRALSHGGFGVESGWYNGIITRMKPEIGAGNPIPSR